MKVLFKRWVIFNNFDEFKSIKINVTGKNESSVKTLELCNHTVFRTVPIKIHFKSFIMNLIKKNEKEFEWFNKVYLFILYTKHNQNYQEVNFK